MHVLVWPVTVLHLAKEGERGSNTHACVQAHGCVSGAGDRCVLALNGEVMKM